MGCCIGGREPLVHYPLASLEKDTGEAEVEDRSDIIEGLVELLLKDSHWKTDFEEPDVTIRSLKGSSLNPSIPVMHIRVDLGKHVAPGVVLDSLNNPYQRMGWDSIYKSMKIVKTITGWSFVSAVVLKIGVPLVKDREFIEHKVVKQIGSCTKVIYSSIELPEAPITDEAERGVTLLGCQMIVKNPATTVVHIISQTDMRLTLANLLQGFASSQVKHWARRFRSHLVNLAQCVRLH